MELRHADSTATAPAPGSGAWLWAPWVDLIVGCGAWTIPLLVLTDWLAGAGAADVALGFALLALVCNQPHYMATLYRAFGSRDTMARYRFYTLHLSIAALGILVAAHLYPLLVPLIFTLYLTWSPWHYSGQNLGLLLLFARRRQAAPTGGERRLLQIAFVSSYLVWVLMVNILASGDPYYWSLELPRAIAAPVGTVLVGLFAATAGLPLWRMARRRGWRAVAPCAVLLSSQALWFVAPWLVQVAAGRRLSPVYYSTGVLAFLHCAQYLWITSYYARREQGPAVWRPWRYVGLLVLGGIALFSAGPWLASAGLGYEFRDSVLIFVAVINLHHFIVDGAVWKLRDRRVAAILIDGESVPAPALATAARRRGPWRLAGWGLASALVVVAGINALHELLTREGTTIDRLSLAARLNPHDSRVAVRRAELLDAAGQSQEALSALAAFTAPLPANAAALRLYGALLINTGQLDAASSHYRTLQHSIGLDAQSQVNLGVIAAERGDLDEAARALHAALRMDPGLPVAHLNLAGVCLMRNEPDCAVHHYDVYLGSPAVARDRQYATAALNAATAAELAGRPGLARHRLEIATTVAARIGAQDLSQRASRQAAGVQPPTSSASAPPGSR